MVWIRGNGVADTSWTSDRYFLPEVVAAELATRPEGRRVLFPGDTAIPRSTIRWIGCGPVTAPRSRSRGRSSTPARCPSRPSGRCSSTASRHLGPPPTISSSTSSRQAPSVVWNLDVDTIVAILDDLRFESTDLGTSITPPRWLATGLHPRSSPAIPFGRRPTSMRPSTGSSPARARRFDPRTSARPLARPHRLELRRHQGLPRTVDA